MVSKSLFCIALLAGFFTLSGDSCRDPARLVVVAQQGIAPGQSWYHAAFAGHKQGLDSLSAYGHQTGQQHWLQQASRLGDAQSLYTLALGSDDEKQQRELLLQAAKLEHPLSQYELALSSDRQSSRLYWLQKAAANDVLMAQVSLYQWWLLQQDLTKAMPWLVKAAEQDADSALILAKILWQQGQQKQAINHLRAAAAKGHGQAQQYLWHIDTFIYPKAGAKKATVAADNTSPQHCAMRLQFVGNSLDSIVQAESFRQQFMADKRLQSLPICINPPVWLTAKQLACSGNWQEKKRIGCDLKVIAAKAESMSFDHLVIFTQQGKANVRNGIMFLDQTDSYQVFVHELAHFAGFVDEYPLPAALAQQRCGGTSAPNLLFVAAGQQQAAKRQRQDLAESAEVEGNSASPLDLSAWLSLGHKVQVSAARTCNNHSAQAYKPVSKVTFMEYHEEGFIPAIYLSAWQRVLAQGRDIVPVYVNFAQYYQQQGNAEKAQYWWQKFREYQSDTQGSTL